MRPRTPGQQLSDISYLLRGGDLLVLGALATFAAGSTCHPSPSQSTPTPSPPVASCSMGWVCPPVPLLTSKVGIWYSTWFQSSLSGNDGQWANSRYRPYHGYYDSSNTALIAAHLNEIRTAGFDFVVFDLTNGVSRGDPIFENAKSVLGVADSLMSDHKPAPQGAMAFGVQLWKYRSQSGADAEANMIWEDAAQHPAYFRIGDRPLLVVQNDFGASSSLFPWNDMRFFQGNNSTTPENPPCVGGVDVCAGEPDHVPDPGPLSRYGSEWWGWAFPYPQFASMTVVPVSPGVNDTHFAPQFGVQGEIVIERRNGLEFQQQWLRAVKQNPAYVVVSSWNEFGDETAIEPALSRTDSIKPGEPWVDLYGNETPDWYLQIATGYLNLRTGLMPGGYYRDEDDRAVYVVDNGSLSHISQAPHGHPIVILPKNTIRAITRTLARPIAVPDGTMVSAPDRPTAVVFGGGLLEFELPSVAARFSTATRSVSADDYEAAPYLGAIHRGDRVYATKGYPPAFVTDLGELWPTDCVPAITDNGSPVVNISNFFYGTYPRANDLRCQ